MKRKSKKEQSALAREYKATTHDPDMDAVMDAIDRSGIAYTAVANLTGVSRTTIVNWKKRRTRRPQHVTMAFALRALGGKFVIEINKRRR